jgi:hypothetical protein
MYDDPSRIVLYASLLSPFRPPCLIVVGAPSFQTHPRQQCFMSSLDLHTHCGYQSMLPEAIAIVVAPTDEKMRSVVACPCFHVFDVTHARTLAAGASYGVFRLTSPEGLEAVQCCERTGFHPHNEPFVVYDHCRHVVIAPAPAGFSRPRGGIKVEDLRNYRPASTFVV